MIFFGLHCFRWNYIAGSIAAGSVIGGWKGSHVLGWWMALVFSE